MVREGDRETFQSRVMLGTQESDRIAGCDLIRRGSLEMGQNGEKAGRIV